MNQVQTAPSYKALPRMVCRCEAYKFPHRPSGGNCCYEVHAEFKVWNYGKPCLWGQWLQDTYTGDDE